VKEVGRLYVKNLKKTKEIKKTTKRDGEGQKSNTRATPNRESNNVEVSEKKERQEKGVEQRSLIPKVPMMSAERRGGG
jgi:hypothetical protein